MARAHEQRRAWVGYASILKNDSPESAGLPVAQRCLTHMELTHAGCCPTPAEGLMPGFQQLPNVWMPAWPALARWIFLWVEFSALWLQKTFRDKFGYQRIEKKHTTSSCTSVFKIKNNYLL
jgi:hypothetical protein